MMNLAIYSLKKGVIVTSYIIIGVPFVGISVVLAISALWTLWWGIIERIVN